MVRFDLHICILTFMFTHSSPRSADEYFADIVIAYRAEIQALYDAGCRNLQFDDPLLAYFCSESMIKGMEERGIDHEALLNTYIRVYNDIVTGHPADMTIGLHLCRGNFKNGRHFSEGPYDRIAIRLFKETNVDCYYLEYDTPRAGTFEPLKHLPAHKAVVLGLITSKFPQLEDVDDLVKRVHNAANIIASGEPKRTFEEALNQCVPCTAAVGCATEVRVRVGSASVPSVGSPRTRREITSTSTRCVRSSPLSWRPRRRSGVTRETGCAGKRKVGYL